jgi:4-amino-4-deoxy-L-arabinose transferase-like glycosyltransferase
MYSPAGLTVGLILIAVGAILVWAVTGEASGVNIDAVGWILMIVGAIAALLSLIFWAGWRGPTGYRRREYVEGEPASRPRRRRVVEEEDEGPPPAV